MKRFGGDKKYLYWGVTAFAVIACSIIFYLLLSRWPGVLHVEDDDIPGSATEVEDVNDHEKTETEEAETDSKMETVEETETEEE